MMLDTPSINADMEEIRETLKKNSLEIMRNVNKLGVSLLVDVNSRTAQATTSATYSKLTDFQAGFKTSGGLIIIMGVLHSSMNDGDVQLKVDDEEKKVFGNVGSTIAMPILWIGSLPEGSHTAKLYFRANGGTSTIGSTTRDSFMYVVELLRG
jgi:hypothetical protein